MKISRSIRNLTLALTLVLSLSFSARALEVITVSISPESTSTVTNYAPIAENLNLTTFRDVSVHGSFSAQDPEGDALSFQLVENPQKGTVSVDGDSFVYTPAEGQKGRDTFTYVATDSHGNASESATVKIHIEKQSVKLSYSDMEGNGAHYAALRLAEENIYTGRQLSGAYFFDPDEAVSRSEFLTMCLNAVGMETLDGITRTGFADDEQIAIWEKPYVSTALMAGVVQGYSTTGGEIIFSPSTDITYAEAMVMLNNALRISDVSIPYFTADTALPVWAAQAAANLDACSIGSASASYSAPLTRADAAMMLCSAMDLLQARETRDVSLLSWAW